MFCAKCGAVLADDARKCNECGAPVRIRPDQAAGKGRNRKKVISVPDEPDMPSQEDVENGLQQDSFMDPVFFREADENLDVDAIIKIARGEDPGTDNKEPEPEQEPDQEPEQEPEMDMEAYLQSLPLIEKLRRRIQAHHHAREEASDHRRMQKHLERASRHFSEAETAAAKAEQMRLEDLRREREKKARAEAERARALQAETVRQQEEKLRAERAEAEKAEAAKAEAARRAEAEKAEAAKAEAARRAEAERAEAEKAEAARRAEAERAEAAKAEAARRREEEARRLERIRDERIATEARQKEKARAAAARRQEAQEQTKDAGQEEREGLEVIRLHGRNRSTEEARVREEQRAADERAAEEALRREAEMAEQEARRREEEKRAEAQRAQKEQAAHQQEEKTSARKNLQGVLKNRDSFKTMDEYRSKELTAAERRMEAQRRRRKYRNNQPDRFDEFLGRYGLTKEVAVRIATLFLIALLSVIYVMGRGSSKAPASDPANVGSSMTDFESAGEQPDDDTGTEQSQDAEESEVPTGGGDFESN